jgi:methylenetetrahydrofolate reductase (NADPH)
MMSDLSLSFEFYPPKTEKGREKLRLTRNELASTRPEFFSVTFGAGGSTQERTAETVIEIQQESGIDAAPHLSCIDSTRENVSALLHKYKSNAIHRIVALRGDIPSGSMEIGEFRYANELVQYIRAETGDHFHIEVAAYPEVHPQAKSASADLNYFKNKVDAGADSAITQYFFNPDAYFRFIERCHAAGISIPIIPGIMPITNYEQLARFSAGCGAEIPRWLDKRLAEFGDDLDSLREFGIDVVSKLTERLLQQGAPGLHFYTLNQHAPSLAICKNIGII